ncbi:MAG TPA: hypothetical protein VIN38_05485 [Thiobacillus sp.]
MLPAPFHAIWGVVVLAAMAGCATPQYQTTVRLIPPASEQGRACAQTCEAQKTTCQSDCKQRFQACARDIEPQVEARYAELLKQYENELKQYAAALRHYEMQLQFEWFNHYPYRRPYWRDPWLQHRGLFLYHEPVMPTRASVQTRLEQESCQSDCSCLPAYDTCYVGCGGQRLVETLCIKNCPASK